MRYELYSFEELDEFNLYNFELESDDFDNLLGCAFALNIDYILYDKENNRKNFIFLDNQPSGYNIFDLGFKTIPTEKECRERILECKCIKLFSEYVKDHGFEFFLKNSAIPTEKASDETDAICAKLFSFKPSIHLNDSIIIKNLKK